jgi:hypothetical protein
VVSRSLVLLLIAAGLSSPLEAGAADPAAEWGALEIQSRTIAPGTKSKFTFASERFFEGSFLDAALWVAHGSSPGPALCVVSGIHGDEINSVEIARRSFEAVDPRRLKGTLFVVPAANAMGFRTMNRYMLDRRDLNRAFPGSLRGSVASIVANVLFENVVKRCGSLIDLHTGSNFRTNVAQIRVDMAHPESLALAEGFGVGVIVGGEGPSGSLRREAVRAGVAAIIYEAGPPYAFLRSGAVADPQGTCHIGTLPDLDHAPTSPLNRLAAADNALSAAQRGRDHAAAYCPLADRRPRCSRDSRVDGVAGASRSLGEGRMRERSERRGWGSRVRHHPVGDRSNGGVWISSQAPWHDEPQILLPFVPRRSSTSTG